MSYTYEDEVKGASKRVIEENLSCYTNEDGSYTMPANVLHSLVAVAICEGMSIGVRKSSECISRSFAAR
jgi:hypothetical protein